MTYWYWPLASSSGSRRTASRCSCTWRFLRRSPRGLRWCPGRGHRSCTPSSPPCSWRISLPWPYFIAAPAGLLVRPGSTCKSSSTRAKSGRLFCSSSWSSAGWDSQTWCFRGRLSRSGRASASSWPRRWSGSRSQSPRCLCWRCRSNWIRRTPRAACRCCQLAGYQVSGRCKCSRRSEFTPESTIIVCQGCRHSTSTEYGSFDQSTTQGFGRTVAWCSRIIFRNP